MSEIELNIARFLQGEIMATSKFRIEMEVSGIDSQERMNALIEALQMAGRQLHAQAMLICGDATPPKVELSGEDLIEGTKEIPL